ncbi:MAG TPA: sigma factor [Candidatus Dormibacteraeota bacterium]
MAPSPDQEPGQQRFDESNARDLADAAGRDRVLNPAEHRRLLEAAGRGDADARESLVKAHLDWVVSSAGERIDRGLGQGDLFQEGTIGLMEAIQEFAGSGSEDFEAFATERISSHMDRALGDEQKAVRDSQLLLQAAHDYVDAELSIRQELGRVATTLELATKLEWPVQRTEEIGQMVADARRRHDEEMLQYLEPDEIDLDTLMEDHGEGDGS